MTVWARAALELRGLARLVGVLWPLRTVKPTSPQLVCDDLEAAVDRHAARPAIVFEGRTITYAELDAMANRYAHWATGRGVKRGDTVALFTPNRIEYVAIWYGLSKVGVATALINNQLLGEGLAHTLGVCGAAHVITDAQTTAAFAAVRARLPRAVTEWVVGGGGQDADRDLDQTLRGVSAIRPRRESARAGLVAGDVMMWIYTSGTTGLPKAAKVTHMRGQLYMRSFAAATRAGPADRLYNTLPLYHSTGGLCAVGATLLTGACMVLKQRFSASQFWTDVAAERCTLFPYIGELCRYMVNQPERPEERSHAIRMAFGNGLRPEVWEQMERRFAIPYVLEFYGATEGNVSLLNFYGKIGSVGRVLPYLKNRFNVRVVRFDPKSQAPVRDDEGRAIACEPGEIGQAIGRIGAGARDTYAGYADRAATNGKILRDAFKAGDAWFMTGDLMRQDREGYLYFVDRVGDTFRWKGENVSTTAVERQLSVIPGVEAANVYGVAIEGAEGRAGMAALVTTPAFDLDGLASALEASLPTYAQPAFLRLQTEVETTGTFKFKKADAAAEGFDPLTIDDPLFYRPAGGSYRPLDGDAFRRIQAGEVRL